MTSTLTPEIRSDLRVLYNLRVSGKLKEWSTFLNEEGNTVRRDLVQWSIDTDLRGLRLRGSVCFDGPSLQTNFSIVDGVNPSSRFWKCGMIYTHPSGYTLRWDAHTAKGRRVLSDLSQDSEVVKEEALDRVLLGLAQLRDPEYEAVARLAGKLLDEIKKRSRLVQRLQDAGFWS